MLDLYARTFDGVDLGEDDYVLSADEKPASKPGNGSIPATAAARPATDAD